MKKLALLTLVIALGACKSSEAKKKAAAGQEAVVKIADAVSKAEKHSLVTTARMNIRKLFDASVAYYEEEHMDKSGKVLEKQFPASVALTPSGSACGKPDKTFPPSPQSWKNPTWDALNFAVDDPHSFAYEYTSSGTGKAAKFVARAVGDPECSGKPQTIERSGTIVDGNVLGGDLVVTPTPGK